MGSWIIFLFFRQGLLNHLEIINNKGIYKLITEVKIIFISCLHLWAQAEEVMDSILLIGDNSIIEEGYQS